MKKMSLGKVWMTLSDTLDDLRSGVAYSTKSFDDGTEATFTISDEGKLYVGIETPQGSELVALRVNQPGIYKALAEFKKSELPPFGANDSNPSLLWFEIEAIPEGKDLWLELETRQKAISPKAVQDSKLKGNGRGVA